jgi:hypothetical protein
VPRYCPLCKSPAWNRERKPINLSYEALGYKRDVDGELIAPDPFVGLAEEVIANGVPAEVDRVEVFAGSSRPVKVASVPVRAKHDPKTCRIYRCLQCSQKKSTEPSK